MITYADELRRLKRERTVSLNDETDDDDTFMVPSDYKKENAIKCIYFIFRKISEGWITNSIWGLGSFEYDSNKPDARITLNRFLLEIISNP